MNKNLGLYIHIPFCVRKCSYCDFTSLAGTNEELKERYVKALIQQIKQAASNGITAGSASESDGGKIAPPAGRPVDTIFFGGGTPSLLTPPQIGEIMAVIRENFDVTADCEITMEANPGTVSVDSLRGYRALGINRLSFGVQSMENDVLRTLGRIHDADEAVRSVKLAREAGFDNLNLDLMFGIPGQTLTQWKSTLKKITALAPEHISFYSLQVEEGTPIYNEIKFGRLEPLTDGEDRAMYHAGLAYLREQGYHQYEISNGAEPGRECRHNVKYWTLQEYAGFGVSAHGFVDGVRYSNTEDLMEYIEACEAEKGTADAESAVCGSIVWTHRNTLEETAQEFLFTGLRLAQGIDLKEFERRFGMTLGEMYPEEMNELEQFVAAGCLVVEQEKKSNAENDTEKIPHRMYLTEKGMDISNRIMALFV